MDSLPVGPLNGHVANLAVLDSFELPPLVGGAVNGSSDLQVLKSVSPAATVTPGATLTYTFTFTNPAPATAPATGVVMRDTIPTHTTYVSGSASDSGSLSGDVVSWPAFDVQPGATVTRTYQVTVNSPLTNGTTIPNAGSYTWDAFPPGSGGIDTNLVITPVQSAPVLTLTKSTLRPGIPIGVNGLVEYTLRITNTGNENANNVVVRDPVPLGSQFVSATHSGDFDPVQRLITWNIGTLAAGASETMVQIVREPPDPETGQVVAGLRLLNRANFSFRNEAGG